MICRTLVCMLFMLPTIAGALGFLLAPNDAYVGRLICFYLTGSYQASFVLALSLITSNTGGQSKKMVVSGTIWAGASIGNIVRSETFGFGRVKCLLRLNDIVVPSSISPLKPQSTRLGLGLFWLQIVLSSQCLARSDTFTYGRTERRKSLELKWKQAE
jgi:hypothetical protein